MSLRFIYGRAGYGKSYFCLNDIKSRIVNGVITPLILLVPEQFSLSAERNLIKILGTNGILGTEVLSFRRLAYRIFSEVGGITYPHLTPASKSMIIYKILQDKKGTLNTFSKAAKQQGFVETISETLTEFKRYNITSDSITSVTNSINNNDLREKLLELNNIYIEYENVIKNKYRDNDDDLTLLANKLVFSEQYKNAEIWIDEFAGFTPQEYMVIEKLLKIADRVNISICTDCLIDENSFDYNDLFYTVKAEVKKLMMLAQDNDITIENPVNLNSNKKHRFVNCEELAHLERHLNSYPYGKYKGNTNQISVFSSVNIFSEIENTARAIVCLCRDKGLRYKDIAVVSGNLEGYKKLIEAIFKEYCIPFFIDGKSSITKHPVIQLISSLFEIFSSNWSYQAVFSYLKTGLTGIQQEDIDLIENYVLACGIKGFMWLQKDNWSYKTEFTLTEEQNNETDELMLLNINRIRSEITKPIVHFRDKMKVKKTAAEISEALYNFLCEINIPDTIDRCISDFRENGQLSLANEYSQVWNIVMDIFDQVTVVSGEEIINISEFYEMLSVGFGQYKLGLIPPSLDQVLAGSITRSKTHEVKALFVLGVNDGIFPSAASVEGVLSDKDRDTLKEIGLELASSARLKAFEEQFQIYTALTSTSDFLCLSYPIADNEGKSMRPSILISMIKKLFPNILEYSNIVSKDDDSENLAYVSSRIPTFNELVANLRKGYEGQNLSIVWKEVFSFYKRQAKWKDKCETVKISLGYTNQSDLANKDKIRKIFGNSIYSSVSRFEKYVSCPFSYYVQYGLKAQDRKIYRLNSPDVGTFIHAVIEKFSRIVSDGSISWRELTVEWCSQAISNIVDEMLNNMQGSIMSRSTRYNKLARRLKRVLVRAVWLIAEHIKRSSFNPVDYEVGFGEGEKFPPITIELSSGEKISLIGRIDRIDALKTEEGTYLRIIDYKSGSKAFKLSDVYYGMQIQLITYLDAIWENGGMNLTKPILPGGMLYFRVDDPVIKSNKNISEENIEKAIIKQLKMKGLLLADVKLIKEMDTQIEGNSIIIPARINKDGVLGRSSAATYEQFEALRKYVKGLLINIGEEMLKGNVSIRPYKNKRSTPCQFCEFGAVCQFDPSLKDNEYRIINDKKDEEIWSILGSTSKGGEN